MQKVDNAGDSTPVESLCRGSLLKNKYHHIQIGTANSQLVTKIWGTGHQQLRESPRSFISKYSFQAATRLV